MSASLPTVRYWSACRSNWVVSPHNPLTLLINPFGTCMLPQHCHATVYAYRPFKVWPGGLGRAWSLTLYHLSAALRYISVALRFVSPWTCIARCPTSELPSPRPAVQAILIQISMLRNVSRFFRQLLTVWLQACLRLPVQTLKGHQA